MKKNFVLLIMMILVSGWTVLNADTSTRKERNFIVTGNKYYKDGHYREALKDYNAALENNPGSVTAKFNKGLAQYQIAKSIDNEKAKADAMTETFNAFSDVAKHSASNPILASKANYNLGNISFHRKDYQDAASYYKEALRLNPDDNNARKNLRLTQLKLQQQNKDNKEKNKENKENNKPQEKEKEKEKDNKKDKEKDNQDQRDQEQNQNKQSQGSQPKQSQDEISKNAADRILRNSENKEKETRAKIMNQGRQTTGRSRNLRNW